MTKNHNTTQNEQLVDKERLVQTAARIGIGARLERRRVNRQHIADKYMDIPNPSGDLRRMERFVTRSIEVKETDGQDVVVAKAVAAHFEDLMHGKAKSVHAEDGGLFPLANLSAESLAELPDWLMDELKFGNNSAPLTGSISRRVPLSVSRNGGKEYGEPVYELSVARMEREGSEFSLDKGIRVRIGLNPVNGTANLNRTVSNPDYRHHSSLPNPNPYRNFELDLDQVSSLRDIGNVPMAITLDIPAAENSRQ